jgi:choline dehydrogenase-like flavoprotein
MSPESYDYVIVGGGTAGCILAARLSEDPSVTVALVEAGPSDVDEPRAADIRRWDEMLESEYDLDYRSVDQPQGNSFIRQARMRILGGCSTANTMITWRPQRGDLEEWAAAGVEGWDYATLSSAFDGIAAPVARIPVEHQNPYLPVVIESASTALGLDRKPSWNDAEFTQGAGFFEIGYDPATRLRSSASRSYLHSGALDRTNLMPVLETLVHRIVLDGEKRAVGVEVSAVADDAGAGSASRRVISARREVIVCTGAIDSPALLQRSGIGPADVLSAAGVEVVVDLPGVGENLQDHAEGLLIWETTAEIGDVSATGWDAGYVTTVDPGSPVPQVSTHIPLETWGVHAERVGTALPEKTVSLVPNVAKPKSRGRVWITSPHSGVPPSIDYRAFTDAAGDDERMLVAGARNARLVAEQQPFASLLVREVFPGPSAQTDEELSQALRSTHQTVYHVSCTCRMGAEEDPLAVLDSRLRVRGVSALRVVDASVFPTITALNPVGTIMAVAERAAVLIAQDRGV